MHHARVLSPATLLFAVCALATAQPPGATVPPASLLSALRPYVGNKAFHDELKLTEAQAKRLRAIRQKQQEETDTTPPKDLKTEEQDKAFVAELKATLDADQIKRAGQLAAWVVLVVDDNPFVIRTLPPLRTVSVSQLARYPEIAAALKLDATQAKLVELVDKPAPAPGGFVSRGSAFNTISVAYLTPAQTAAAQALIGKSPATPLSIEPNDGPGSLLARFGLGGNLTTSYLLAPDVQKDLKLRAEQVKTIATLQTKYPDLFVRFGAGGRVDRSLSPAEQKKANEARLTELNGSLDKLLTPEQKQRLEQIGRQQQLRVGEEFATRSKLGEVLGVTDEQRKAYAAANAARAAAVLKAVGSGDPLEKVKGAVEAAGQARIAAIEKILNAEQVAKKQAWIGKPFTGSVSTPFGRRETSGMPNSVTTLRKLLFGKYSAELVTLTRAPKLREELKLTQEQVTQLNEAARALREKFPTQGTFSVLQDSVAGEKLRADRSAFVAKALADILTKEQRTRFHELLIQQAEAARGTPALVLRSGAVSIPGVAEAIKLTVEQKKRILDGTPEADVLTDNQKATLKTLRGKEAEIVEIFARPGSPVATAPFASALPAAARLPQTLAYWDAIKVTPEQATRLTRALNAYHLATGGGAPTVGHTNALRTAFHATLTADQRKRLEQIRLQAEAANNLEGVLLGTGTSLSAIPKELGITDEQEKAIRAVVQELTERASLLDVINRRFTTVETDTSRAAVELRRKLRNKLDDRIEALLTPAQKEKWKAMLGEPHPGFSKQPLFSRSRGGFGGFGGFEP
ncbi:MAG: hypothetical protein U0840_18905 [Gemmataceae bacterium]